VPKGETEDENPKRGYLLAGARALPFGHAGDGCQDLRLASEGVICFGTGQLLFVLPEHAVEAVGRAVTEPGTHRCGPAFDRGSKEDTP
jgi:hypothetical protein